MKFSQRQIEVAALIAEGVPQKEIADRLGISRYTVRQYLDRIFAKIGGARSSARVACMVGSGEIR